jgi:hypothetical protein
LLLQILHYIATFSKEVGGTGDEARIGRGRINCTGKDNFFVLQSMSKKQKKI